MEKKEPQVQMDLLLHRGLEWSGLLLVPEIAMIKRLELLRLMIQKKLSKRFYLFFALPFLFPSGIPEILDDV